MRAGRHGAPQIINEEREWGELLEEDHTEGLSAKGSAEAGLRCVLERRLHRQAGGTNLLREEEGSERGKFPKLCPTCSRTLQPPSNRQVEAVRIQDHSIYEIDRKDLKTRFFFCRECLRE